MICSHYYDLLILHLHLPETRAQSAHDLAMREARVLLSGISEIALDELRERTRGRTPHLTITSQLLAACAPGPHWRPRLASFGAGGRGVAGTRARCIGHALPGFVPGAIALGNVRRHANSHSEREPTAAATARRL